MPPKYPKKPKKPKEDKKKPKKPKKPKKKNTKMKKYNNDTSSDIKTDTLDLNEPLRYNVKQSIINDKKIKPQDVFEY